MMDRQRNLGFNERLYQEASQYEGLVLGRVVAQHRDQYSVAMESSEIMAEISGKMRYQAQSMLDYPVVGDFVMLDRDQNRTGKAQIQHLLSRKTVFLRKAAGTGQQMQVVAANIDTVFICMAMDGDFNLRRLERYLAIAWDSGAVPVVVLTKSDLCADQKNRIAAAEAVAPGVDILTTSSIAENGVEVIKPYVIPGNTVVFVGSSGVGKSTLLNRLLGEEQIATREVRKDGKGRHTTTHRELKILPAGGAVIDTPGMRELGLETADLSRAFQDIEALAASCRFHDCTHQHEPGCALRQAVNQGMLEEKRLASFLKLRQEVRYEGMDARQIEKVKIKKMFSGFGGAKNARNYIKGKTGVKNEFIP